MAVERYDRGRLFGLKGPNGLAWLVVPDRSPGHAVPSGLIETAGKALLLVDPVRGLCRMTEAGDERVAHALAGITSPVVLVSDRP